MFKVSCELVMWENDENGDSTKSLVFFMIVHELVLAAYRTRDREGNSITQRKLDAQASARHILSRVQPTKPFMVGL
jgi:hypothetical protein